ncbi:MAG TPA: LysR family transcriptional regulator [Gemmataceae bacterium]|nr:LysR family transcriptional regulator [Gemmataceae bacterium]
MARDLPSLSTDQVAAFVELARHGSLRAAAAALHVTEQGVRNRLLALEGRVGAELYLKRRGPRQGPPLTRHGELFLPHALAFLDRARDLAGVFGGGTAPQEIHVAATQYLILYVLVGAIRRFHDEHPAIRVRLSTHSEREIEDALVRDPELDLGVAAPYESGGELDYAHMFTLDWGLVAPRRHRLLRRPSVGMADLVGEPLILFERGSTGRQHVLDAFRERDLTPRVELEATSTAVVVRMVEAGLGVALVPLTPGGEVTRGHRVGVRPLPGLIRPIHSGVLTRKGARPLPAAQTFVRFLKAVAPPDRV